MSHFVLLGDSIFDNPAYTKGGPDVVMQVRALFPKQWKACMVMMMMESRLSCPSQRGLTDLFFRSPPVWVCGCSSQLGRCGWDHCMRNGWTLVAKLKEDSLSTRCTW